MHATPVLHRTHLPGGIDVVLGCPTVSLQPALIVAPGDVVGACGHGPPVSPSPFLGAGACEEAHSPEDPLILELEARWLEEHSYLAPVDIRAEVLTPFHAKGWGAFCLWFATVWGSGASCGQQARDPRWWGGGSVPPLPSPVLVGMGEGA